MQTSSTRTKPSIDTSLPKRLPQVRSFHTATVSLLFLVGLSGGILLSWLLGNPHVSQVFAYLQPLQESPPWWLDIPQVDNGYYLFVPTVLLFTLVQVVTRVSPQPNKFSRRLMAGILFALLSRYIVWRALSTLNLSNALDGSFSLILLGMEVLAISGGMLQLLLMFTTRDRDNEADIYSQRVLEGAYCPSVDVLIPTYNEPEFILRRTVIGCQALDYDRKKIYLLDDTRRVEIRKLAEELGCNYITRPDNSHAKAGNLNHAITKTISDLIVVFDADFVPTRNFLQRTVGFFQNQKTALVQTPQSFYNSDPIARNLNLEDVLTSEEEVFYRHMQPIKDGAGSVVCAGTSFVVRRSALQQVGGFVTESLSEDYFTGVRLAANGYDLVYLDEKLSAGLAAENISAHLLQRLRWARGTLQAFFISSNPLTIPGLNLWQRLGHLEGLLHWFNSIPRLFFLLLPVFSIIGGIEPLSADVREAVYFFFPYYLTQLTVFSWLNMRSRSALLSDLYSLVQCFPLAVTVANVMLNPFSTGFKVTPKGIESDRYNYNWRLALPLVTLLIVTMLSLAIGLSKSASWLNISLWWCGYNLITLSASLLVLLDIPITSPYQWFNTHQKVQIVSEESTYYGCTTKLSEEGVEVLIAKSISLDKRIIINLVVQDLALEGTVVSTTLQNNSATAKIQFQNMSLVQQRKLVEMLYCSPGCWKRKQAPGELHSLLLIGQILSRPLLHIYHQIRLKKA